MKFSLRDLLVLIAFICVACAALANTGIWWHSLIVTVTLAALTGLILWGLLCPGEGRAFAAGWLLFAAGYLGLVFGPWTASNLGPNLVTTKGLAGIEWATRGDKPSPPVFASMPYDYDEDGNLDLISTNSLVTSVWSRNALATEPVMDWTGVERPLNCTTFQSTGHWLLSVVLGYLGGAIALAFWRRKRAAERQP
jgi:hypothetical protein